MRFETPAELFARLNLGREEFCQRLLTTLILEAPYPKWNTRSTACPQGVAFLRDLHSRSFGSGWPGDEFVFVDEFELPARTEAEKGGYPDYSVLWDDKVWLIELKTESGSHRADQIPYYFELARHHHPHCDIDFTYLTGPGSRSGQAIESWERFSHVEWADLIDLIDRHWPNPILPGQAEVVAGLEATIRGLTSQRRRGVRRAPICMASPDLASSPCRTRSTMRSNWPIRSRQTGNSGRSSPARPAWMRFTSCGWPSATNSHPLLRAHLDVTSGPGCGAGRARGNRSPMPARPPGTSCDSRDTRSRATSAGQWAPPPWSSIASGTGRRSAGRSRHTGDIPPV